ncbi:MAG: hypothetical protein BroJett011_18490 [Chloroflexota bacterium]|nr:MAG: hypothetical protein BroJett011_18490 [Chloroflexota bacterium]
MLKQGARSEREIKQLKTSPNGSKCSVNWQKYPVIGEILSPFHRDPAPTALVGAILKIEPG